MHVRTPSVGTLGDLQTAPHVVAGPRRERSKPKPMMNGLKKSDEAVRPARATNKGVQAPAELPEERASTKGNPERQSTRRTQGRGSVPQAAGRIREAAERNPKERLTALFHHITPDALRAAYFGLKKEAAAGVDGVTWATYGEGLDERLLDLHSRLHRGGAYRAPPVRRVEIPKPDGGRRPLGIAALEDKIVQKAVVDVILTPIHEVEFLGFSYGFRPGRGTHDALDALAFGITRRKVNWIADADLKAYFDTIPRDWLIRFLEHRIGDRRVIRLIRKWLNAGVMDDGTWADTGMGTSQGNIVSPCLANVFLYYVLDLWFHRKWRPNVPEGEAIIVRYADDIVVGFQYKRDAERYLRDVRERLDRFASAFTRTRHASWSSDGTHTRTVARAGRVGRRRSTFWASRISARRPGRGVSGLVANRSPSGSTGPWRVSARSSAGAGTMTSGLSAHGLGGSFKAGSTTLPFRGQAGGCRRSAAGFNACGCRRCAAAPSVTALIGNVSHA